MMDIEEGFLSVIVYKEKPDTEKSYDAIGEYFHGSHFVEIWELS